MASEPWRIRLFGALQAERGSQVISRFKYQKVGALLAYLAYYLRQMHPRELLVEIFWPENSPEAGRANLSVALSSLRHQFESLNMPAGTIFRADRYAIGLNPEMIRTDVEEFEQAVRSPANEESIIELFQRMERAVNLYQGRLLPAFYEEWIGPEQERLAGLYYDAVAVLLRELEQQGELSEALRYARQSVSLDPLREETYPALLRLLIADGQPEAALRQYRELERLLQTEIGAEPSPSLRALARQIEKQSGLATAEIPLQASPAPSAVHPGISRPLQIGQPATLTFMQTDLAGPSSSSKQAEGTQAACLRLLRSQLAAYGGQEIRQWETSLTAAFPSARKAVACAVACQQALAQQDHYAETGPLPIRIALHTGDAEALDNGLQAPALRRAASILISAHGGQILISNTTAELLHRDPLDQIEIQDLGLFRLRDVSTPERLHQVNYPGMAVRTFPTPTAEPGYHSQLPVQVTRFFGREQEIARIAHLLGEEKVRLLTLTGAGGTGKTRLAIEAAERLVSAYEGAVWFVSLADLNEPKHIPGAILDALRLQRSPKQEALEQAIEALNRRPCLLVLDNFEHLVEEGAPIVQQLLSRAPSLIILLTSRQLLGLTGEREFVVLPLPTPNGGEEPAQLSLFDSVRLFVDRAQAVLPHFQVTNRNAPALAELCLRLEGIPLALELAAARAQVLTPSQMLAQLENRFDFLAGRKRDVSERQRTLRGAIEWSYRLLSPELQRFLNRLSVFRGGWTAGAAEAVCEEPLALDYLAQLRECSQIFSEETEAGMRFRMLETIREYASEQLKAAEETDLRKHHTAYFLALAEEAKERLTAQDQAVWLQTLETENDNLRHVLTYCREAAEEGLRLGAALSIFWDIRSHLREGREWLAVLLSHPLAQRPIRARAEALNGAGILAWRQGDYVSARSFYEQSQAIWRQLGDNRALAGSLNNLGLLAFEQSDDSNARTLIEEALTINRDSGNRAWEACNLNNLGMIAKAQGDNATARLLYEESLEIERERGYNRGIAICLYNLGNIVSLQGDYVYARSLYEESLKIRKELEDRRGLAFCLDSLGTVAGEQGDDVYARSLHEESLEIFRELDVKKGIAGSLGNLGNIVYIQGNHDYALSLHEESLSIYKALGDLQGSANCLNNMANVFIDKGDYIISRSLATESLTISKERADQQGIVISLKTFARLVAKEMPTSAARLWGAVEALREKIDLPFQSREKIQQNKSYLELKHTIGEEEFTRERNAGRFMALEEAIIYALQQQPSEEHIE